MNCKSVNLNLDTVVLSVVHLGNWAHSVPSDLVGSVEVSKLELDGGSSLKSSIGNAGSVNNCIVVSIVSGIVLKISSSITSS